MINQTQPCRSVCCLFVVGLSVCPFVRSICFQSVNNCFSFCSIEFDRDNDYFAIAGVTKKIKVSMHSGDFTFPYGLKFL